MSNENNSGLKETTVKIKRCAAVVKGGRRFSFAAMVVNGDGNGRVGRGYGKANEVPPSVEKANKQACLLYTSPSPRDRQKSRMPSSA